MNRTADPPSPARRRGLAHLPAFALHGADSAPAPVLLHIESIHSRSRLDDGEIDAHVHQGLHQLLWLRAGSVEAVLDKTRSPVEGPAALVVPPGAVHAFRFSRESDGFVLTVNATRLAEGDAAGVGEALQTLFAAPRLLALDAGTPELARLQALFEALHAENEALDAASQPGAGPVPMWLARAVWVWGSKKISACTMLSAAARSK